MKVEIEISDIKLAAKAVNNATAALGWLSWAATLGAKVPDKLSDICKLEDEEIKVRFRIMKDICNQIEVAEKKVKAVETLD